jgi:ATP-dependent DNA ligase
MLKRNDESYQPGRRVWLKFKKELIERMKVTGFKAGKMGPHSVVCGVDAHGVKVQCKTLDNAMRAKFDTNSESFIGRTLVFNYQQKTDDGRYRHPRCDHFEE